MFPISQIYFFVGGVEESIAKQDGGIGDHGRICLITGYATELHCMMVSLLKNDTLQTSFIRSGQSISGSFTLAPLQLSAIQLNN